MTAPLFIVEWDPTTDTAHVRATFETVTAEETVAGLDQFAACWRKLREINDLTGISGRETTGNPARVRARVMVTDIDPEAQCNFCGEPQRAHGEGLSGHEFKADD